jgi:hypothetical protein
MNIPCHFVVSHPHLLLSYIAREGHTNSRNSKTTRMLTPKLHHCITGDEIGNESVQVIIRKLKIIIKTLKESKVN